MKELQNIGWLYFRDYFQQGEKPIDFSYLNDEDALKKLRDTPENKEKIEQYNEAIEEKKKKNGLSVKNKNSKLFEKKIEEYLFYRKLLIDSSSFCSNSSFLLQSLYPGILIGAGYNHETATKGELKLGIQFDYTTGLPIIPGSSIKGVIKNYLQWEFEDKDGITKTLWQIIIEENKSFKKFESVKISELIKKLFPEDGEISVYSTDLYLDAFIAQESVGKFLGIDSITPHHDTKNPIPLPFLKVLPGVIIKFNFYLHDTLFNEDIILSKEDKEEIFKLILITFGIGAKTNVGYGKLTEKIVLYKQPDNSGEGKRAEPASTDKLPPDRSSFKKGTKYRGIVTNVSDTHVTVQFEIGRQSATIERKRAKINFDCKKEENVIVSIEQDYIGTGNLNCKILKY